MPEIQTRSKTLQVGDRAPDFVLKSHLEGDRPVRISDLQGANVLLAFYPVDWSGV